jgi:hypothetical protein
MPAIEFSVAYNAQASQIASTLIDIKHRLHLHQQSPFILGHFVAIVLLQRIDGLARDERVEYILILKLSTVKWLVGTFDLDRD